MSDINTNVRHQCYREHRQVSRIDLPEGRRRRHGVGQISRALSVHVHLGKADLRYIVKMASDRIDPATVTFSKIIYKPVCNLYNVGLIIKHNEQRLFAKASP